MKFILATFFSFIFIFSISAQSASSIQREYAEVRARYVDGSAEPTPLRAAVDLNLQADLMTELKKNPKYRKLIAERRLAVSLVDLSRPGLPRFAAVNGDHMMYAASLPKIAVLFASVEALETGRIKSTPEIQRDMKLMIAKSDNHATTRMIDRVGMKFIQELLQRPEYNFYDETRGGGLWVGKRYAASSAGRIGDPLKNISHAASATQVARFYYQMYTRQLVSPERSKQMLNIMKNPKLYHKFVNTLLRVAPDADIYRKSGSWRNFHSDSALVIDPTNPWRRYILVGLAEDPEGGKIMKDLVLNAERALRKRNDVRL